MMMQIVPIFFGGSLLCVAGCRTVTDQPQSATLAQEQQVVGGGAVADPELQRRAKADIDQMVSRNQFKGHGTIFSTFGGGGGACGISEEIIAKETGGRLAWVALNVFNTPDYTVDRLADRFDPHLITRPVQNPMERGLYENGNHCGRWIRAKFQVGGSTYTSTFVVADSCGDGNEWCRSSPGHVDLSVYEVARLATPERADCYSLEEARANQGWGCYGLEWPNADVEWEFIESPNPPDNIFFHWFINANPQWHAVTVSNLKNGISGLQYNKDGVWQDLKMDSDAGQRFALPWGVDTYQLRVKDRNGKLYPHTYTMTFPTEECTPSCGRFIPANPIKR